jgi:hypothetical protein
MNDWIKIFRKFREWGWYDNGIVKDVFLELLLTANSEPKEWNGLQIKRGQSIITRKQLSKTLGFTEQNIRTSLTKLKSTNEITIKTYTKFSVVTINNYNKYQQSTNTLTNNQPTTNQQLTTPKEDNTNTNNNNIIINTKEKNKKEKVNKKKKEEKKYYGYTLQEISDGIILSFKQYLNQDFKITTNWTNNLIYWLDYYTPKEIEKAIANVRKHKFWYDKMTPVILFRRRNPQGEPADYLSQLLITKQKYE